VAARAALRKGAGLTPERWRRITAVFHAVREGDPARRDCDLANACGGDATLRRDVEAMLAGRDAADELGDAAPSEPSHPIDAASGDGGGPTLPDRSRLGPYEILGPLGAGGMGQVYKARDSRLDRDVAIKVASQRFSAQFEREVRAVATLNHPNICTLHDVGPNYLVMELVEGETLRDWLTRALPVERSLEIARQVLEALRDAHQAGVVHGDLKPENVMVRFDGYVKVLDFGLATRIPVSRVLQSETVATVAVPAAQPRPGEIFGTIAYMSPEQIHGDAVDQRSDLFAFGIMLYEMLTGRHPWVRPSPLETLHAILHDDPPPMSPASLMLAELAAITQKLLRKNLAERYATAEAVLDALGSGAGTASRVALPRTSATLTSIAVLPFVFFSEIEERHALSLGFADALITMLGRIEDVTVLPTSAILRYPAGTDPAGACRDLGVRHVLLGNVQKRRDQWRVSLQLFDAMTQRIVFAETHDFVLESVFEVQDEIGRRVVESLRKRFPAGAPTSRERYSSDPQAYHEFMAGLGESYADRPETLESAIRHLSAAVARDPEFALAHAWLSYVLTTMHFSHDPRPARLEQAEHHCRRALALAPALPEAHLARAYILWSPAKNFQHADALDALSQVVTVQPNVERAHNQMASIYLHIGRLDEARAAHARAQRSNPLARSGNLEFYHLYRGDFASADAAGEAWVHDRPDSMYSLFFYPQPPLMTGDLDRAEARLAAALQRFPAEPLLTSLGGMLYARRQDSTRALASVQRALESPRSFGHTHHTYYQIACTYSVLGDTRTAMAWLERSVDTGFACWPFFQVDPHLDHLRATAEFNRLVDDLARKYAG
jgi:serine/threonine protein kinase